MVAKIWKCPAGIQMQTGSKLRLKNGYTPKNKATVYKHILAMHVPDMIREATNIKQFSCQAIEKLNSDAKSMFLSSNKHDSTKAIVLKKEHLSVSTERHPNDYCFMYS
ncbi:hypothetical protein EMCRGX_G016222 [Ephydatia muelleri]